VVSNDDRLTNRVIAIDSTAGIGEDNNVATGLYRGAYAMNDWLDTFTLIEMGTTEKDERVNHSILTLEVIGANNSAMARNSWRQEAREIYCRELLGWGAKCVSSRDPARAHNERYMV
jgi:hypothetical protein